MSDEIQRMDIAVFRRLGYLQEVNRRFLHPLGLALEVRVDEDGTETLGGVWDYRDDPEGMVYDDAEDLHIKAEFIDALWSEKASTRQRRLGFVVQPAGTNDGV